VPTTIKEIRDISGALRAGRDRRDFAKDALIERAEAEDEEAVQNELLVEALLLIAEALENKEVA
jgi:hypothetical protein